MITGWRKEMIKMKKNDDIHIKISSEKKNQLRKKAENNGLTLSQYCLFILLNSQAILLKNSK